VSSSRTVLSSNDTVEQIFKSLETEMMALFEHLDLSSLTDYPVFAPDPRGRPRVHEPPELLILTELFDLLLKRSKACEDFLFGSVGRSHKQARRDDLRTGDHPSKVHSFACCKHIRQYSGGSYERLSKSTGAKHVL
jgi:hypothetical protein